MGRRAEESRIQVFSETAFVFEREWVGSGLAQQVVRSLRHFVPNLALTPHPARSKLTWSSLSSALPPSPIHTVRGGL